MPYCVAASIFVDFRAYLKNIAAQAKKFNRRDEMEHQRTALQFDEEAALAARAATAALVAEPAIRPREVHALHRAAVCPSDSFVA